MLRRRLTQAGWPRATSPPTRSMDLLRHLAQPVADDVTGHAAAGVESRLADGLELGEVQGHSRRLGENGASSADTSPPRREDLASLVVAGPPRSAQAEGP